MKLPYRFGRYRLVEKIGQGGMAEIYKGEFFGEGSFVKAVVVKRILPAWFHNKEIEKMLIDEAHALVRLSHPNIVQVFELGKDGRTPFISMEYVEGIDLRKFFDTLVKEKIEVPLKYILFIISESLRALDYAHQFLIHRDISPQNILLSFDGAVKVADFGIAKGDHRSLETTVAQVKGKYAYMSPEQAAGENVEAATDLYAMGVILYELLARQRRYQSENDLALLEEVRRGDSLMKGIDGFSNNLQNIVQKALEKDLDKRYAAAKEFLSDLMVFVKQSGEVTNGYEFGEFLKVNFSAAREKKEVKRETIPFSEKRSGRFGTKWWSLGFIFVVFLLFGFGEMWIKGRKKVAPNLEEAWISVQVRPWGRVTIPQVMIQKETPIVGFEIPSGEHSIQIDYPPKKIEVHSEIKLQEKQKLLCLTDFTVPDPKIVCH